MDPEFALVLYRALMMVCRYLEKRFGFGSESAARWVEIPSQAQKPVIE